MTKNTYSERTVTISSKSDPKLIRTDLIRCIWSKPNKGNLVNLVEILGKWKGRTLEN